MNDHCLSIQEESDYDCFHPSTEKVTETRGQRETQAGDGVVTCNLTANQSVQIL
jgi:hypothetical protein